MELSVTDIPGVSSSPKIALFALPTFVVFGKVRAPSMRPVNFPKSRVYIYTKIVPQATADVFVPFVLQKTISQSNYPVEWLESEF
jgi:hypothetical protein